MCNLFVISVYMSHRTRTAPSQHDTIEKLQQLLSEIPARDCICLLGDFNEQLEAGVQDCTGKWTGGPPTKNSDAVIVILRMFNLVAINTMFRPKKHANVHTFLQTKRSDGQTDKYIGRAVKAKYKGKWVQGRVIESSLTSSISTSLDSTI